MKVKQDLKIPGYRIEREIGCGGMATVYLAFHESLGCKVALKVMAPALSSDNSFGERFQKEGRFLARLKHPNIVSILEIGAHEHKNYLAMEYLPGKDLKTKIQQGLTEKDSLGILRQITAALVFAHEKGVIHRDVKPENILFRNDGAAVLSDFGIAKAVDSDTKMTGTGMSIGTPHYMSPEQARGFKVDARSDLYSLGVVFYEMLAGERPYNSDDSFAVALMHINDPIPELKAGLSPYQPILDQLLAKNPDDRYKSGRLLLGDIENLMCGQSLNRPIHSTVLMPSAVNVSKAILYKNKTSARRFSTAWKWALNGAILAVVSVSGFYMWQNAKQPIHLGPGGGNAIAIGETTRPIPGLESSNAPLTKSGNIKEKEKNNKAFLEKSISIKEPVISKFENDQNIIKKTKRLEDEPDAIHNGNTIKKTYPTQKPNEMEQPEDTAGTDESLRLKVQKDIEINRLFSSAEIAIQESRLIYPKRDNSLEYYKQILKLDPKNERAVHGLKRTADKYETIGLLKMENSNLHDCLKYVSEGLFAFPAHKGLASLKHQLEQLEKTQLNETEKKVLAQKSREIEKLFVFAEAALNENRLTSPSGDNALEYYRQILSTIPDDKRAKKGIERIADKYEAIARSKMNDGRLTDCLAYIERGLMVCPKHNGLNSLKFTAKRNPEMPEKKIKPVPLPKQEYQQAEEKSNRKVRELINEINIAIDNKRFGVAYRKIKFADKMASRPDDIKEIAKLQAQIKNQLGVK